VLIKIIIMSKFGKKALIYWDYTYSKEKSIRFNHTPLELQLKILEKWYPIGIKLNKLNIDSTEYELIGYQKLLCGTVYNIKVKYLYNNSIYETYHNTILFKPTDGYIKMLLRDEKLSKLGL